MNDQNQNNVQVQTSTPENLEPRVYTPPRLIKLGALEQVQGRGGVFRDFTFGGYYPSHD